MNNQEKRQRQQKEDPVEATELGSADVDNDHENDVEDGDPAAKRAKYEEDVDDSISKMHQEIEPEENDNIVHHRKPTDDTNDDELDELEALFS